MKGRMMVRKALIIEDVYANRYLVAYLLKQQGWETAEAEDATLALQIARTYLPDVILLDVGLPGEIRGYDIIAPLRALLGLARVPIIAVTSYAMGGDREQAFQSGCNGYIEKPIDPDI